MTSESDPVRSLRHDLRTPINHIVGYAELLLEEADAPPLDAFASSLQSIVADARQGLSLLGDLLEAGSAGRNKALLTVLDRIIRTTDELSETATVLGLAGIVTDLGRIDEAAHRLLDQIKNLPRTRQRRQPAQAVPEPAQAEPAQPALERPVLTGTLLVVDDDPGNRDMLSRRLERLGYGIVLAENGQQALDLLEQTPVDVVLLDIMMPELDGFAVLRRRHDDPRLRDIPVLMISAMDELDSVVRCIEMGAEDYLSKPFDPVLLRARIGACLEKKRLRDQERALIETVQTQAAELREWNRTLEQKVAEKVEENERLKQLRRFLSPQLANAILKSGENRLLESHRREVTVVFCDLRGFTAFAETAEPEDVMGVLREYHTALGPIIFKYEGTLEHFAGDGMMTFFNDPIPCEDPAWRAVQMAVEMREAAAALCRAWRRRGHDLDFGVGIAVGYATCGQIGFEGRFDYGAIGTVTNLSARLCGEAKPGQILVTQRVHLAVEDLAEVEPVGEFALKGFARPVAAYNIVGLRDHVKEKLLAATGEPRE